MPLKDRPLFRKMLDFHDLVRGGRRVTCTMLAARWGTSTKTVQRFVNTLRDDFGAPVEFSREKGSFVYTNPDYRLPWLPIDGKDLFAIAVAGRVLEAYEGTPAAADLRRVFERFAELMPARLRVRPSTLADRLYIRDLPGRPVRPAIWNAVAAGLADAVALEIRYQGAGDEKPGAWRLVEPYGMAFSGGNWLLAARDPDDGEVKNFHVARIAEIRLTKQRIVVPKSFDPRRRFGASIGTFYDEKIFRFRIRLSREVADAQVRWHPDQVLQELKNGDVELDLPASSLWEARRFVLSFGHFAKVLSPPELVKDVKEEIQKMARG